MEKRQNAQQHVVAAEVNDLVDGADVRADVAMREHHALGLAGRAGGEDDRQQVVAATAVEARAGVPGTAAGIEPGRPRPPAACRPA